MGEWYFDIDYSIIVIFISAIVALFLQLLLCYKAKRLFIKLLPIALLIVSTITLYICAASINGWDGFGYLFFALLSFGLVFVCGIGWGVWATAKNRNR